MQFLRLASGSRQDLILFAAEDCLTGGHYIEKIVLAMQVPKIIIVAKLKSPELVLCHFIERKLPN